MSASTRHTIVSETAIGRPASSTRRTRQRASSRCFCSRFIESISFTLSPFHRLAVALARFAFVGARLPFALFEKAPPYLKRVDPLADPFLEFGHLGAQLGPHRVQLGVQRARKA